MGTRSAISAAAIRAALDSLTAANVEVLNYLTHMGMAVVIVFPDSGPEEEAVRRFPRTATLAPAGTAWCVRRRVSAGRPGPWASRSPSIALRSALFISPSLTAAADCSAPCDTSTGPTSPPTP